MNNTALAVRADDKQLDALRRIATQATDPKEIRVRLGRGGMQLKYTDGAYVIRTLNAAFGWDWDFVADSEELLMNNGQPFEVKVRGTLTVRLNGQAVTKTQYGCQPIEMLKNGAAPVSIGDCYKGAATDALKKCASMLGIALDLYDSDSEVNTGKKTPTNRPQPARESEPVEAKPEPQRNGSQASRPQPRGTAGQIVALAKALGWDDKTLAGEIHDRFKITLSPENFTEALATLPYAESQELIQALKAELENRNRTR